MFLFNTFFFTLLLFCSFMAFAQWRLTKDASIPWYIGYLLFTFVHYAREFWIVGSFESGFVSPPDLPLSWGTPSSYAAFACYCRFVWHLMDIRTKAPIFSRVVISSTRFFVLMAGINLLLQVFGQYDLADKAHLAVQTILFPAMLWSLIHLLRRSLLFYQKLIIIGTTALVLGFVCVIAIRIWPGQHDLVRDMICCFPMYNWGHICFYHLKVGIVIDVMCFSWALTLQQKILLQNMVQNSTAHAPLLNYLLTALRPEDEFLCKIRAYLAQKIGDENLSVEQVATEAARLSVSQTNRKMKEKTGLTTEQFILRYRLEMALKLLHSTDQMIGEVAFAVGFRETAHFSNAFKKHFGQTPSEMRKASRGNALNTQENAE